MNKANNIAAYNKHRTDSNYYSNCQTISCTYRKVSKITINAEATLATKKNKNTCSIVTQITGD